MSDPKPGLQSSRGESEVINDLVASAEDDSVEDFEDSTTLPSRPNKFRGPPSTWRNRTAFQRDLATSLDQLQAKDLSIHLYNTFKLKQRNRIGEPSRQTENSEDSQEANEGSKWIPPKVWTAWPLAPETVPREHDETSWEEATVLHEPNHSVPRRPGQHLKEMLVAQVLRRAKERFHARQMESASQLAALTTPQGQQSRGLEKRFNGTFSAKKGQKVFGQKPAIMADDQQASEILQPTVQHIMTKLDDLLMGLHHARSAYLLIEESDSETNGQISEQSTSRGRSQKRKRRASKADEHAGASPDEPNYSSSDSDQYDATRNKSTSKHKIQHAKSSPRRSRSQKFRDRKGRLGLRDWSDVLGIASMLGWDQTVIGSATARCATLFEEGIKFRTLDEGRKIQEEHVYLPNAPPLMSGECKQSDTWRAREARSNRFESAMFGGVHVDGFLKPIEGKKSWKYSNKKQSKRRQSSHKSSGRD